MIHVDLQGFSGTVSSLISGTPTSTGTKVTLRGPLADAINKILKQKEDHIADLKGQLADADAEIKEMRYP